MEWLGVGRRRLGTGMLVFGIVGLLLAAAVTVALVAGGIAARGLDDKIAAGQDRIAASLTRLTLTMDSVATSIDNASATLQTSRDGVVHAGDVLNELAGTADSMASALDISILGQQPFTGTIARLHNLEAQIQVFQGDTTKLAANLDQNAADAGQIAGEVRDMRSQVAELAAAVTTFADTRDIVRFAFGGIVLGGFLTAWQAVLAGAIAWAGLRLRRLGIAGPAGGVAPVV
jgi:methyl-accepting chemotaxis protein